MGPFRKAEQPFGHRQVAAAGDPGVLRRTIGLGAALRRQVLGDSFLEVAARAAKIAHAKGGVPERIMSDDLDLDDLFLLGDTAELHGHVVYLAERPGHDVGFPKTVQGRDALRNVAQSFAQRQGSGISRFGPGRAMPLGDDSGMTQGELERDFLVGAFFTVRELVHQLDPLGEVRGRLQIRSLGPGPLAGPAPVVDGALRVPRLGVVMRDQLRVRLHGLGEAFLHQRRDLLVMPLTRAL